MAGKWKEALEISFYGFGMVFILMIALSFITEYIGKIIHKFESKRKNSQEGK